MTSPITDQPPIATSRRPAWEIVVAYVENAYGSAGVTGRVLADMRARDAIGRQRYSTPLTSDNGRDHLVDAAQEYLDSCAYLCAALDAHGIAPATEIDSYRVADPKLRGQLRVVQGLFAAQIRAYIQLRALIEDRSS